MGKYYIAYSEAAAAFKATYAGYITYDSAEKTFSQPTQLYKGGATFPPNKILNLAGTNQFPIDPSGSYGIAIRQPRIILVTSPINEVFLVSPNYAPPTSKKAFTYITQLNFSSYGSVAPLTSRDNSGAVTDHYFYQDSTLNLWWNKGNSNNKQLTTFPTRVRPTAIQVKLANTGDDKGVVFFSDASFNLKSIAITSFKNMTCGSVQDLGIRLESGCAATVGSGPNIYIFYKASATPLPGFTIRCSVFDFDKNLNLTLKRTASVIQAASREEIFIDSAPSVASLVNSLGEAYLSQIYLCYAAYGIENNTIKLLRVILPDLTARSVQTWRGDAGRSADPFIFYNGSIS
jgi:hypothetical protein